ncbi:MAG: TetR/AcrR family transcriptional regulator, partial [Dehalococcoidia bacterium]
MVQHAERADARANRQRLIAAAQELFRERGLDAEMKEIAERAGLGVGTIYRNFPTKDDLFAAIIGEAVTEIQTVADEAAQIDDPVEAIRHHLLGGLGVSERYGDVMMALLGGKLPPACVEQFQALKAREDPVAPIVRAGIERGIFRPDIDPTIVGTGVHLAMVPWAYQELRATHTR